MTLQRAARAAGPDSAVSVVVPCFNHGVFLEECLASVQTQTSPAAEVIVVDDGSTDRHTLEVLERVAKTGLVRVIHQPNSGPSAARNRALREAAGDLILPLDADNRLAPTALATMKATLLAAPDEVRWVYPHQNFFGNRTELAVMPEFNLWLLLERNFCDTGSLIDRSVFDTGCRYREDIGLGHEDWDFFLTAAEHGFIGIPCHAEVLFVRKHGFTRSDLVEHQLGSFTTEIRRLHPGLFAPPSLIRIKQEWAPALSLVLEGGDGCADLLNAQTSQDFESVGHRRSDGRFDTTTTPPIDPTSHGSVSRLAACRGRWVLLWPCDDLGPFADPAFVEKAVVVAQHSTAPAVAVAPARGEQDSVNWRSSAARDEGECIGLLIEGRVLHDLVPGLDEASSGTLLMQLLARLRSARGEPDWRTVAAREQPLGAGTPGPAPTGGQGPRPVPPAVTRPVPGPAHAAPGDPALAAVSRRLEQEFRHRGAVPLHLGRDPVTRLPCPPRGTEADGWDALVAGAWSRWQPEHTATLLLIVDPRRARYVVGLGDGFETVRSTARIDLGRVYTVPFPGTTSLWRRFDARSGSFDYFLGEPATRELCALLGYVSTAHLPGMVDLREAVRSSLEPVFPSSARQPEPFVLAGATGPACLEAVSPPPARPVATAEVSQPIWSLYETIHDDGRIAYATHPDAVAVAARSRPVGGVLAAGRTAKTIFETANEATGGRAYVNLDDPPRPGFAMSVVLGSLMTGPLVDTVPLIRLLAIGPGPHAAVHEPGHRLTTSDWGTLVEAGTHAIEGMLGDVVPTDGARLPLFRWRHRARPQWRYSLGARIAGVSPQEWVFDGTLGMAYAPGADRPTTDEFVELRHPVTGEITYTVGPAPERLTHHLERVVAGVDLSHGRGSMPLFRLRGRAGGVAYSVNPEELALAGYEAEGPVGYLGLAVPPPFPAQPTRTGEGMHRVTFGAGAGSVDGTAADRPGPGLAVLVTDGTGDPASLSVRLESPPGDVSRVVGYASPSPFLWAQPIYELIERRTGARVLTTDGESALGDTHDVLRVVAYLGTPGHGVDRATLLEASVVAIRPPPPPAAAPDPTEPGLRDLLAGAADLGRARLPPPVVRTLGRARRSLRRLG